MSLTLQQVAEHNSAKSCWVIINGKVYDVTEFLANHPGGSTIILKYAGRDATKAYEPIHPPDTLDKNLPANKHLGALATADAAQIIEQASNQKKSKDELRMERAQQNKPPLGRILSLDELESVARQVISYKALAYYSSAADDEISHHENVRAYSRFFFHPRVLRAVSKVDPSTRILSFRSPLPLFVSGAALARLGHPLGEANITRGCGKTGVIQMASYNASLSPAQIAGARIDPEQVLFFQLYKHRDADAIARVREIEQLGFKAIFLTVDAVVPGNRERDIRAPFEIEQQECEVEEDAKASAKTAQDMPKRPVAESIEEDDGPNEVGGTAGTLLASADLDMTWEKTIPWLRGLTKLPIVLKGIQCVADAVLAVEAGVDGILISNHGGRQLEYSLPSIEVLHRIRKERPDVFEKTEVYIDGGIRRGTDVLKALCLGAKAVGLGRPFLYAQSAYGEAGVVKAIRILEREIITGMRLLGARTIEELVPEMVERVDWQPEARSRAKL